MPRPSPAGCGGSGIAASQLLGLVEHATSQAMGGAQQSAHGGGLALTSIVRCAVLLVAPTESVTWKETVRAAGLAEGSLVENSTERSAGLVVGDACAAGQGQHPGAGVVAAGDPVLVGEP